MSKHTEICSHPKSRRRIFIVDTENAIGAESICDLEVVREKQLIESLYSIAENDFVVIGVSHSNNVFPAHTWKDARIVFKRGHDGAGLALKQVLKKENIEQRFDEVIIVSGDGTFAEESETLRNHGLKMTIHAEVNRLAKALIRCVSLVNVTHDKKLAAQLKVAA